jgi:MFS transporter, DHA2 family, methylenomycin A resistance protein
MVPLDLFRSRPVAISLAAAFVTMAGFYAVVFVQSLYFQQVRAATPLETGLLFLPMTALVAILNPSAAKLALRFGSRVPIIGGQVLMALGLIGLAIAPIDLPVWAVALLMVPVGVGGSFTVPPLTSLPWWCSRRGQAVALAAVYWASVTGSSQVVASPAGVSSRVA